MDRQTQYFGALVAETDPLKIQQNTMVALGFTAQAFLGTATAVDGFGLTPTTPASLVANLGPGAVYQLENVEATAWSSLPANTASSIVKQGLMQAVDPITFTPPAATGYSQAFLVEVQYADLDTNPVLLPYYNATNPAQPYSGPGGSGASQNTARLGIVAVQVKAGAASAGTPVVPTPDAGWSGLYVVTLAAGATAVTAGNITTYAGAPLIPVKLPAVPSGVQSGAWTYGQDQGTSGALAVPLAPVPSALTPGMSIRVRALNAAKGSDTLTIVGTSFVALSIQRRAGLSPQANDWAAGDVLTLTLLPGNVWQLASLVPSDILALDANGGYVVRVTDTANASTSDVLVGSTVAPITAYVSNAVYEFTQGASANATTTPTGNITPPNGTALGALTIVKKDGSALAVGDLPANATFFATWNAATNKLRLIGLVASDIQSPATPYTGQTPANGGYYVVDVSQGTNFVLPNPAAVPVGWRVRIKAINTPTGYQTSQVSVATGSAPQALNYCDSVHSPFYLIGNGEGFWFENTGTSYDVLTASQPGSFGLYASNPGGASSAGGTGSNIYMPISAVVPSGPGVAAAFNRSSTVASLGVPVSGIYQIIAATSIVGQSGTVQQGQLTIADSTAINNDYYNIGAYANQSFPAILSVPILVYLKQGSPLSAVINCPTGQNYVPSACIFSVFLQRR